MITEFLFVLLFLFTTFLFEQFCSFTTLLIVILISSPRFSRQIQRLENEEAGKSRPLALVTITSTPSHEVTGSSK